MVRIMSLVVVVLVSAVPLVRAEDKKVTNPLEPLGALVSGEWIGEGHGPTPGFRTRVIYEWGIGHRIIKMSSFRQGTEGEHPAYETICYWHPKKKQIVFTSVSAAGGIFEGTIEAKGDTFEFAFEAYAATGDTSTTYRQTIKLIDQYTTQWQVFQKKADEWVKVIDSKQRRKSAKTSK